MLKSFGSQNYMKSKMNNQITVIDIEIGNSTSGFAIRIGEEISSLQRLANCISWDLIHNSIGWKIPLYKYASNQLYTRWHTLEAAMRAAIHYRDNYYPNFKVRVDCTIA